MIGSAIPSEPICVQVCDHCGWHILDENHVRDEQDESVGGPCESYASGDGEVGSCGPCRVVAVPLGVTDEMVRRAAEAIEDEAVRLVGRDLGTVHRDRIVRAGLEAALSPEDRP